MHVQCGDVRVPVSLTPGGPRQETIWGRLCSRGAPVGKPVQVLVHGYTLTHDYWDFLCCAGRYSYVDAATARGYATLAIDRLGVGNSSKPPALAVTLDSNAETVHQVIEAVRAGTVTGARVTTVVLVGHSFGTAISVTEAGRYRDVNAVVATGFLHTPDLIGGAPLFAATEPAQVDPAFATAGLPLGYVTTRPGTRSMFYEPSNTDPAVVKVDEQTKDTGTLGEVETLGEYLLPISEAQHVDAPVLLAVGEHDLAFCTTVLPCPGGDAVVARERPYFAPQANLTGYVLPDTGHNIALELNSTQANQAMLDWADSVLSR
jgi:pimeloyl-ACP methyl ester carboxylesterase